MTSLVSHQAAEPRSRQLWTTEPRQRHIILGRIIIVLPNTMDTKKDTAVAMAEEEVTTLTASVQESTKEAKASLLISMEDSESMTTIGNETVVPNDTKTISL